MSRETANRFITLSIVLMAISLFLLFVAFRMEEMDRPLLDEAALSSLPIGRNCTEGLYEPGLGGYDACFPPNWKWMTKTEQLQWAKEN